MRTLIVSDLHLGARSGVDVLRRPAAREALLAALDGVDRLVLLGDVFELRHGPVREALAAGRELFLALGRALAGREIVLLGGNHDHGLLAPWLQRRALLERPPPLGLESAAEAAEVSPAVAQLAQWAAPARMTVRHPGIWVREDVWAHHGHYLDVHSPLPSMERLASGAMGRLVAGGRPPATTEDYEARLAPLYAWADAVAAGAATGQLLDGHGTVRAWRLLRGGDGQRGLARLRSRAAAGAFPALIATLNRAGLGPLSAHIAPGDVQRAGLQGMAEVLARLAVPATHVIFGHTHRAGPRPEDDAGAWRVPGGAQLHNSGSWVYETHFMSPGRRESPYWPGRAVLVEACGPPRLLSLLADASDEELCGAPAPQTF